MGVTSVLLWKDLNGGHQGMINFHERITTTLLGRFKEKWDIQVKLYRDTGDTDDVIIEAEREMEKILEKLKNLWHVRQTIIYEGYTYIIGDFLVRVANPNNNTNYKGMLVEVEYISTINPYAAEPILREFIEMLKPQDIEIAKWEPNAEDSFSKVGLSEDAFTRAHTDYQYMMLFKLENL